MKDVGNSVCLKMFIAALFTTMVLNSTCILDSLGKLNPVQQWFSTKWEAVREVKEHFACRRHVAESGNIFRCHNWEGVCSWHLMGRRQGC